MRHPFAFALLAAGLAACGTFRGPDHAALVDPDATAETRALFLNLRRLAPEAFLFGHQDAVAYGVTWSGEEGRSDVRDVAGAYPALYGWDVGHLERGGPDNLDGVPFDDMARWILAAYARGGVHTISWHMDNPVTGGSSWDTTSAVRAVLPGGARHALYLTWLDRFADWAGRLRVGPLARFGVGEAVPILFRPFHEMNGSWFWWGGASTTPEDYRALWRFTVDYLRDERGVDNLLYVYAPDVFETEADYLRYYPGDDYVDVLGLDDYYDVGREGGAPDLTRRLRVLVTLAEARGKLAALTETGVQGMPRPDWWTGVLLQAIEADPIARRIAWVLVWRNANARRSPGHYFATYPGQASADDFVRFYERPGVLFEDELPDLYELR